MMDDTQKIKELKFQLKCWKKVYSKLAEKLDNINTIIKKNMELLQ